MPMASSAISHFSSVSTSSLCFNFSTKLRHPTTLRQFPTHFTKSLTVSASTSTSLDYSTDKSSLSSKTSNWQWKFKDNSIKIHYEEHGNETNGPNKNILMMPTISDVSTVEEWRLVAKDIVQKSGDVNWRATIVDWPGLGFSDRPKLDYNADVMESFLVDFILDPNSPVNRMDLVIVGGGHAATIAIRAAKKGLVKPTAIAAVAPTWSGPLPIVFGRDSKTESRYELLRGTLRAPAVGWMMYNMLVSNKKSIQSQYKSHVYADSANVTPAIIENRYELTKQKGARYVPAAFLTGLLDPVKTREEFLQLFEGLDGKLPVLVVSTSGAPKRSKAEMEALREAKGVSKFVEVPGALLPHEEYPSLVAKELHSFLQDVI
ncbi:putative alpha/beta hydrolase-1 [Helianthus annuus]|uniref:Alpha/beta hydrolase-1 n=1 Tax=Helianthus annuus TaxID=4232 RepID=A0A9K3NNJ9_HELAN|nr:putative alpha/beta hydrolase-1 [Helianthus annuus]KAJ0585718.1 putative alpha/beta hydrolase-1 [Helianthus annuus]KAJ0920338.1 putative alpha/beta hydrolase-1 [Helianthus annuus]